MRFSFNNTIILSVIFTFIVVIVSLKYNFFSDLTNIGIFFTAVLTLLTLSEVRKQRESSYKPVIHLKERVVSFNLTDFPHSMLNDLREKSFLEIFNIGFGAAKNIEIEWDSNISQRLIDQINNSSKDIYKCDLYEESLTINDAIINDGPSFKQKYEFLLPVSKETESQYIIIPYSLIILYPIVIDLYLEQTIEIVFPIKITYFDYGNQKHKDVYNLKLSLYYFNKETKEGSMVFTIIN